MKCKNKIRKRIRSWDEKLDNMTSLPQGGKVLKLSGYSHKPKDEREDKEDEEPDWGDVSQERQRKRVIGIATGVKKKVRKISRKS